MVLWFYGSMILWFYGSRVLWFYDCTFMVLWFYGSMVLWFCDSMIAIANCWLLCEFFGDRLWDFRGSMWIFRDLCEFFGDRLWNFRGSVWIFLDLCEFFWWSSVEFSWLYVNLPWSMWILLGDRLWNFRGSVWIFPDLCEFYVQLANCLVVVICMWPFRLSSSVYFSAGCLNKFKLKTVEFLASFKLGIQVFKLIISICRKDF